MACPSSSTGTSDAGGRVLRRRKRSIHRFRASRRNHGRKAGTAEFSDLLIDSHERRLGEVAGLVRIADVVVGHRVDAFLVSTHQLLPGQVVALAATLDELRGIYLLPRAREIASLNETQNGQEGSPHIPRNRDPYRVCYT